MVVNEESRSTHPGTVAVLANEAGIIYGGAYILSPALQFAVMIQDASRPAHAPTFSLQLVENTTSMSLAQLLVKKKEQEAHPTVATLLGMGRYSLHGDHARPGRQSFPFAIRVSPVNEVVPGWFYE